MDAGRAWRAAGRVLCGWMLWAAVCGNTAEVEVAGEIKTSSLPLVTIRQFLDGARLWGEQRTVRLRGTVTHCISDKTFFIQDGDAGTYVFHKPSAPFRVGELVEVVGLPSLGGYSPTLQYCEARAVGPGKIPDSIAISPSDALTGAFHMRLVTLQGYLADERLRGGRMLVMDSVRGGEAFTADLESETQLERYDDLLAGSLLEITGVCSVRRGTGGKVASFNLFVRSPEDVRVIRPPAWWTLKRTILVLVILASGLLLAVVWIGTLRREVRRQTASVRRLNEQLEQRVRERTEELVAANREMEAFNYSVSHDLRTPLRYISGFVALAREEQEVTASPALQKYLRQISDASEQMGRLIDALLAFSKMSRQPLARQPAVMSSLVDGVIKSLAPDAAGRDIEWKVGVLPDVHADPEMLRLVWTNLISNALKYTRSRKKAVIEIDSRDAGSEWVFSIRDNGVGFDSRYAQRLFEVFQRLHRDDEFEGTGVGLANVRRIVERHGGRIWAESAVDRGATFHFTLPKPPPSAAAEVDDKH